MDKIVGFPTIKGKSHIVKKKKTTRLDPTLKVERFQNSDVEMLN